MQRDPEGERGAIWTEYGLSLLPEGGAATRPLGKPLVGDPYELAPTRKRFAVVGQNREGALHQGDGHTNLNPCPPSGRRSGFLTGLSPRPRLFSKSHFAAGGRFTSMLGGVSRLPLVQRTSRFTGCIFYVRPVLRRRGAHFLFLGEVSSRLAGRGRGFAEGATNVSVEPRQRLRTGLQSHDILQRCRAGGA